MLQAVKNILALFPCMHVDLYPTVSATHTLITDSKKKESEMEGAL